MPELLEKVRAALADRYTIERELGRGGMSVVYLAQDLKPQRYVAVKVLRPEVAAMLGVERFVREIEIACRLNHPHILPLYDSGEAQGLLYYVMPCFEGRSLRDRLDAEKQLPLPVALRIATQVASALSYAHSHDIVHRDIKPENILLAGDDVIVADFGIARAITAAGGEQLTSTGIAVGTPAYMSPEQAAGEALDGRSDVYSLGCVLYEMLAGQPPYTGPTAQAIQARRMTDPVPPLRTVRETVPIDVEEAIVKALAKVPADRFGTAVEFANALTIPTTSTSATTLVRRSRRAVAVSAVGILLLAVAAAVIVRFHHNRKLELGLNSVAVLYFDNLSPDTADAYLADGLTEELIFRLGRIERLQVKSRQAVRRYRADTNQDPAAIGRALGVAYLVSGSVRHGDSLRVTVEMVRTATGQRVWSEQYDRSEGDVLVIEEDVGRAVATAIGGRLVPAEQQVLALRSTRNPAAYDHFLRGNYLLARRDPTDAWRAVAEYDAAVRLDPSFARALARIGLVFGLFLDWGWPHPGVATTDLLTRGSGAVDRSLALDSANAEAWVARGFLNSYRNPGTFEGVLPAFERAIVLEPRNAEVYHQYGGFLNYLGQDAAALAAWRRALALEPERAITLENIARGYYLLLRRYDQAERMIDSAITVDPAAYYAYETQAWIRLLTGNLEGARVSLDLATRLSPPDYGPKEILATFEAREGDTTGARARMDSMVTKFSDRAHPSVGEGIRAAMGYAQLGDQVRALRVLESVEPRGVFLSWWLRHPGFDPLRAHPRFQRLVEQSRRTVP